MKKELIKSLKILALALIIGAGTTLTFAVWNEATSNPPEGNASLPINESSTTQTKTGILNVTNGSKTGTITADMLSVFGTSYFGGDVLIGDEESGTTNVDLHVTGKVGVDLDAVDGYALAETLDVVGTGRFSDLDSTANTGATYPARLCVTTAGSLTLCPPPVALSATITGPTVTNQDYQPQGGGTANCTADVAFSSNVVGGDYPYSYSWRVKNTSGSSNIKINGVAVGANVWKNIGTGASTNFDVFVKTPGDAWTIELTATDEIGTTDIVTQNFDVWTIPGCAD